MTETKPITPSAWDLREKARMLRESARPFGVMAELLPDGESKRIAEKMASDASLEAGRLDWQASQSEREEGGEGGEADSALRESERYRAALDHTRRIEDEFRQDLARMGHPRQPSPEVRREIEEKALAYVQDHYGEHAAAHCRRLLAPSGATADGTAAASEPSIPVLP